LFSFIGSLQAKDKILIGAARPLSGPLAFFEANAFGPIYKMWVKEVNAKGGIYVKEYGKRLPIEMLVYDDKSDMGTMTRLLEKLILRDKVDFLLPPASTAFLFASGAIANRYKHILIGAEGGLSTVSAKDAKVNLKDMPYFFGILNFAEHYQIPALTDIYEEIGVKTASIIFIEDLHGIEYSEAAVKEFGKRGIKIMMKKSTPPGIKDATPLLKEAQQIDADALCVFAYPDENFLITGQLMQIGYNPRALLFGPGGNFAVYKKIFGPAVLEGVMGEGAWNTKSTPESLDFHKKYIADYPPETLDWWGHNIYYTGLQMLEQAIEKAGTLDQEKIRDVLATQKFDTIMGKAWFEDQLLAKDVYTGQIGQWQDGIFEVIDVGKKRTASPSYPKPVWPKQ
jgi:branched-chain amino acid transport system substrate-binding protein